MLRMAVSVPEDLANLDHEFDATTKTTSAASAGSNTDDTLESSSLYASSSAVGCYHNKAAFDLVTEALHLSSNFDDLDIDTN